jgi:hypothetical protein
MTTVTRSPLRAAHRGTRQTLGDLVMPAGTHLAPRGSRPSAEALATCTNDATALLGSAVDEISRLADALAASGDLARACFFGRPAPNIDSLPRSDQ